MYAVSVCMWHQRVSEEKLAFLLFASFWPILAKFVQLNFFQKSKCVHHPRTRRHLCAKFDVLRPSQS